MAISLTIYNTEIQKYTKILKLRNWLYRKMVWHVGKGLLFKQISCCVFWHNSQKTGLKNVLSILWEEFCEIPNLYKEKTLLSDHRLVGANLWLWELSALRNKNFCMLQLFICICIWNIMVYVIILFVSVYSVLQLSIDKTMYQK